MSIDIVTIAALLIAYQLKHFLADFPLQGRYMLGKFKTGIDFVMPLTAHCAVHAGFTCVIAFVALDHLADRNWFQTLNAAVSLAGIDFGIHFIMDRIKAAPHYLGRFKSLTAKEYQETEQTLESHPNVGLQDKEYHNARVGAQERLNSNRYFWWCLGFDQAIHHLTHYYIIFKIVTFQ